MCRKMMVYTGLYAHYERHREVVMPEGELNIEDVEILYLYKLIYPMADQCPRVRGYRIHEFDQSVISHVDPSAASLQ